jgi:hypothetical protein
MRTYGQRIWALSLQSQLCVSLTIGSAAAFTVLGAGLALIKFHGGIWPWWFHGVSVALITGLITTLLTHLHVREVSRRETRRLAGELMSHEVCTALQILLQCKYLQPNQRTKLESEAIERLRVAAREILPNLLEMSTNIRPSPLSPPGEAEEQRKDREAKGLE